MFAASKTASVSGGYQISRSLRFNSADSAYLARTPASASNQQIWTINTWVKRSKLGTLQTLLRVSGVPFVLIDFTADDKFSVDIYNGSVEYILKTTQVFRDVSAWGMMTIAVDTTQATSSDRVKIYWNGVQITAFVTSDYPPQNNNTALNSTAATYIGGNVPSSNQFTDFYLTEFNLIDGQQLTPSSFGETNAQTGVWQPKAYSGSYGTNGFYLNFSDNSNTTAATLGKDYSGNGNNWTPNNFSVTAGVGNDSFVDVPTPYGVDTGAGGSVRGNYCTLNPLNKSGGMTLSDGNLRQSMDSATGYSARGTIAVSSGKWYAEAFVQNITTQTLIGVCDVTLGANQDPITSPSKAVAYYGNSGAKFVNASSSSYGATWTTGDTIGIALDMDALTVTFYKNNTSQGSIALATTDLSYTFFGQDANYLNTQLQWNFGQRPFAYTAPSGFKALCTQNFPTPTIGATSATLANKYFDTVLRTGAGGGTYSTTVNMANGALLWDKPRNQASSNYLMDSVRGIANHLRSNQTGSEVADTTWYTAFNNGSYTTGATDWGTGVTIVDWIWAANGSGTSNAAGSITSTVSANTTSGFSIVTYTGGAGVGGTIGHGLGVAPSMYIVKCRGTNGSTSWATYHKSIGAGSYLLLNSDVGTTANNDMWNNTAPTSTVFSVGTLNEWASGSSSNTYVAYCFAEVAGYSKIGSYTGNGSSTGPFIYTGFRPAWILVKNTSTAGPQWWILDNKRNAYNFLDLALPTSLSLAEQTIPTCLTFLSNGFQVTTINGDFNTSSSNYIYMAFAESPFKYALAR